MLGIISIIFQAFGLFSPAWLVYSLGISGGPVSSGESFNISIEVRMGLWATSACVQSGFETECRSIPHVGLEDRLNSYGSDSKGLLGEWTALQILAVISGVLALAGLVALIQLANTDDEIDETTHTKRILMCTWLISAILILVAVIMNSNHIKKCSSLTDTFGSSSPGLSLKFETAWAMIMSGVGGGFAALVPIIAMGLFRCTCKERRESPGVWKTFETPKEEDGGIVDMDHYADRERAKVRF